MEYEFMERKERMVELSKGARRMLYELEHIEERPAAEILGEYISLRYLCIFGRPGQTVDRAKETLRIVGVVVNDDDNKGKPQTAPSP